MRCGENTEEISSLIWHPQLLKLQQNAGNLPSKMPRHWSDGVAHFREVPLEFSLTVEVGARALLDIGEKRGSVRRGGKYVSEFRSRKKRTVTCASATTAKRWSGGNCTVQSGPACTGGTAIIDSQPTRKVSTI